MKLRDAWVPVMAAGMAFLPSGCAEKTTTEQGTVTGFDHTQVIAIEEKAWVDESSRTEVVPIEGEIEDVTTKRVKDGCIEVPDTSWFGNEDEFDCGLTLCSTETGDPNYCKRQYHTEWNFQRHVWQTIGVCALEPATYEVKNLNGRTFSDCVMVYNAQQRKDLRRQNETDHYFVTVWVRPEQGSNKSDKEKPKSRPVIVEVNARQWAETKNGDCVTLEGPEKHPNNRVITGTC